MPLTAANFAGSTRQNCAPRRKRRRIYGPTHAGGFYSNAPKELPPYAIKPACPELDATKARLARHVSGSNRAPCRASSREDALFTPGGGRAVRTIANEMADSPVHGPARIQEHPFAFRSVEAPSPSPVPPCPWPPARFEKLVRIRTKFSICGGALQSRDFEMSEPHARHRGASVRRARATSGSSRRAARGVFGGASERAVP